MLWRKIFGLGVQLKKLLLNLPVWVCGEASNRFRYGCRKMMPFEKISCSKKMLVETIAGMEQVFQKKNEFHYRDMSNLICTFLEFSLCSVSERTLKLVIVFTYVRTRTQEKNYNLFSKVFLKCTETLTKELNYLVSEETNFHFSAKPEIQVIYI